MDRPRRALDTRVRTVRGRMYVARGEEIHELTDVAALIWRLADGSRTLPEIAAAVAAEYDVDEATAAADAARFVQELDDSGFLETRE